MELTKKIFNKHLCSLYLFVNFFLYVIKNQNLFQNKCNLLKIKHQTQHAKGVFCFSKLIKMFNSEKSETANSFCHNLIYNLISLFMSLSVNGYNT